MLGEKIQKLWKCDRCGVITPSSKLPHVIRSWSEDIFSTDTFVRMGPPSTLEHEGAYCDECYGTIQWTMEGMNNER